MSRDSFVEFTPFGDYAPSGLLKLTLATTRRCSTSWLGKRFAFLMRGLATRSLRGRPVDVVSLGARMRLYPHNNSAEKRLLFTPQYFDPRERAFLVARLKGDFVFLDVGASVGGYALAIAAISGPRARILAVEPLPALFERLAYNIGQSDFANVKAVCCALADVDGEVTLFVNTFNQGECRSGSLAPRRASSRSGAGQEADDVGARGGLFEDRRHQARRRRRRGSGARSFLQRGAARSVAAAHRHGIRLAEGRGAARRAVRRLGYREILRTGENVAYELAEEAPA